MQTLQLDLEELKILEETLQASIGDLEVEAGHTDAHDFKEKLRHKKVVLDRVLQKVRESAVPA